MGWPADPELRRQGKKAEYERHKPDYIRRAKVYKKTPVGRKTDRNWRLKKLYGLTGVEWDKMFEEQKGMCKICEVSKIKHTDHDHKTGRVRGLLCHACNIGLGGFKDDPKLLARAARYLGAS